MREMEETRSDFLRRMEHLPTQAYIGLSLGSILLSAFFYMIGRRSTALFVGQWAPTFGIFALIYKLIRPSQERPIEQMRESVSEMSNPTSR